jgi:cytochrome c oxidase subunit 1
MPRRIPDYADAYAEWNAISSFGSIISLVATVLFGYIIYDLFINGQPVANSPWEMPEYFESMIDLRETREIGTEVAESLEWALGSPVAFHGFEEVPTECDKF